MYVYGMFTTYQKTKLDISKTLSQPKLAFKMLLVSKTIKTKNNF